MDGQILVQCQHCKHQFPTMILKTSLEGFKASKMFGNQEPCPACHKSTLSGKDNMAFKTSDGRIESAGPSFHVV